MNCLLTFVTLFTAIVLCTASSHRHHTGFASHTSHRESVNTHTSLQREAHTNNSHIVHPQNGDTALWSVQTYEHVSCDALARQVCDEISRTLATPLPRAFARVSHRHRRLPPHVAVYESAADVDHTLVSLALSHAVANKQVRWFDRMSSRKASHRSSSDLRAQAHTEPLFAAQWHLHDGTQNTGYWEQVHMAPDHLGVQAVWAQQVYGAGVHVAVVDDGLDHSHPDFAGRYDPELSHDYDDNDDEPSPRARDSHGTAAAGLIAAGVNSVCGVGVAPLARVAGIRLIADFVTDYAESLALTHHDDAISVYSNSWGPVDDGQRLEGPGPLTQLALEQAVLYGRNGSGTVYVWASGNGRHHGDSCAYDGYASARTVISVGAVGYFGTASYYSEGCAALLCVAPSSGSEGPDQVRRITTTDLRGAYGDNAGDCLSNFGGTSAAAPMVAGVVALVLSEVPALGWRDVQQVIARTASRVDPTHASWQLNGADLWHSHLYGFGRVNASAALTLARHWAPLPRAELLSVVTTPADFVPVPVAAGLHSSEVSLEVQDRLTVEFVDLYVTVEHPRRGALEMLLYSPFGTRSELATLHMDNNANYTLWRFGSRAVLGERSTGTWRFSARDLASSVSRGFIRYVELRVYGHVV